MKKLSVLILIGVLLTGCNSDNYSDAEEYNDVAGQLVSLDEELLAEVENEFSADEKSDIKKTQNNNSDIVYITEKLFIAQINDIYINTEDYLDKIIKYEGIFKSEYIEELDSTYNYIFRYGPGCCGDDGIAGFEVVWDGELPRQEDWVEAVGVLEFYDVEGEEKLHLKLSSLTVLNERGAEVVSN